MSDIDLLATKSIHPAENLVDFCAKIKYVHTRMRDRELLYFFTTDKTHSETCFRQYSEVKSGGFFSFNYSLDKGAYGDSGFFGMSTSLNVKSRRDTRKRLRPAALSLMGLSLLHALRKEGLSASWSCVIDITDDVVTQVPLPMETYFRFLEYGQSCFPAMPEPIVPPYKLGRVIEPKAILAKYWIDQHDGVDIVVIGNTAECPDNSSTGKLLVAITEGVGGEQCVTATRVIVAKQDQLSEVEFLDIVQNNSERLAGMVSFGTRTRNLIPVSSAVMLV